MTDRVVVVGAGIGGLVAALGLACRGLEVTLLDRAAAPGGKMREVEVAGRRLDAGPTVFTMRWVLDAVFAGAGTRLEDHLTLQPAAILARHAWPDGSRLDLFADLERTADAVQAFAGAREAAGFRAFTAQARAICATLEAPFIRGQRPTMVGLVRSAGLSEMWRTRPFDTLWSALSQHFADPRLRQLFGRYATYCGSSPFLAPATLMLVAHVEREGVWMVEGGMHRVAAALATLAAARGVTVRMGADVAEVLVSRGRAAGVRLRDGEQIEASAVVVNADPAALSAGLLGAAARGAVPPLLPVERSLSALTWAAVARAEGFPLHRHTVFFSGDYDAEFAAMRRGGLPVQPTTYICAGDRDDGCTAPDGPERLLILVNAPATGDMRPPTETEIAQCRDRTFSHLAQAGLRLTDMQAVTTGPAEFHSLFPGTGGALYGPAVHGATATFKRPGSRTRVPGLYLAGGGTHPGAGVPMAALSGGLAAESLMQDLASTRPSRPAAMPGGTWTRSATTGSTASR